MNVKNFLKKYNINNDFENFFDEKKIEKIENFLDDMEKNNIKYVPERENIFKVLDEKIENIKILILGMDPYKQKGVATGLAFEVKENSWCNKSVNTSLKNILKLIYFSYTEKIESIERIRDYIKTEKFLIKSPDKIFDIWKNQGVFLLNTALTTKEDKSGEHLKFWKDIISELVEYISKKNTNIIYFLWGNNAQEFKKYVYKGSFYECNHPAICGNLKNDKDFMNSKCFIETKSLINWSGYKYFYLKEDF